LLNRKLKRLGELLLPAFLLRWLDPVQALIDTEVRAAAAAVRKGAVVLDAGAGESRCRGLFPHGSYVALDLGSGDPTWDYSGLDVRGDLQQLPLRSSSVDAILCMVVLEHTRNPRRVLEEFARVLKPGGRLRMVVPFLWEEHQTPHDYFRFTRYGVSAIFELLPFEIDLLQPIGGFFWVCARRSVSLLTFFQGGWRWIVFLLLAPFFGLLFPVILFWMDGMDRSKHFSLGFQIRARKQTPDAGQSTDCRGSAGIHGACV
jgi:SAM-dependent methyltransferase